MTRYGTPQKLPRLVESEFHDDLGIGNIIFVGSSCDLFAEAFPVEWLDKTLEHCSKFDCNRYLFQTKNPSGFQRLNYSNLPTDFILATTIETNRRYVEMGLSPSIDSRVWHLIQAKKRLGCRTMITIEPVMDFDLDMMIDIINECCPALLHIGANTHPKVKVSEPDSEKLTMFIAAAEKMTEVHIKPNLKRLVD
jgi:DNA repair photolyase